MGVIVRAITLLHTPLDSHEGLIALSSVFVNTEFDLSDDEEAQTLIRWVHVQKLFHFIAVPGSVVPRTPVACKLRKLSALEMHVLSGCRNCRGFFPLGQSFRPTLPAHHDSDHL